MTGLKARAQRDSDLEGSLPSAEWLGEIRAAIEAADGCLVVVSPSLASSEVCAEELDLPREAGKRIVPVMVRPTDPPSVPVTWRRSTGSMPPMGPSTKRWTGRWRRYGPTWTTYGHTRSSECGPSAAAILAGEIYASLERKRDGVGVQDALIAGICRRFDLPLATRNVRHFKRVRGPRVIEVPAQ